MQLLNNIIIFFTKENIKFLNFLFIPGYFIEAYLTMTLFLICFNVETTYKQKFFYVFLMVLISIITSNIIPQPFNIFINYTCVLFLIKIIFNLSILKSIISLFLSTFIFGILNLLLQNPYMFILNISLDMLLNIPIYRLSFLMFMYIFLFIICLALKKIKKIRFSLDFLDNLDKRTLIILYINLIVGFLTISIQLFINTFYIDIVPLIITFLSFILLISFFALSIYSFTRVIKLSDTSRNLESAKEYNKSLEILYDKLKGFQHDFNNIITTLDGFIENNDINGLREYFIEVKKDCKITNNLSLLNPRTINNPGIYSLLNNKYFKATNLGISFEIDFFLDLNELKINIYEFSRILGILIDNAIEEAEKCSEKIVNLSFKKEYKNHRSTIIIQNTYSNKNVNIEKIFNKGLSGKENHSGIGLWEVKKYISKTENLDLFTSKTNKFFKQELSIYD